MKFRLATIISRKFGFSGVRHLLLFSLLIFVFYITTSYYSVNNDKISSLELFNETVNYGETPIAVNTEAVNIEGKKEQKFQLSEKNGFINETISANSIHIGEIISNCGFPKLCKNNEFVVHLYSGKDHNDEPRICIDGKYVLTKAVNEGGRGMNVAVVDTLTKAIIRVGHFDTYEKDSVILETLLLTLRPGDIVILLTFDEPSRKLSRIAKLLLFDLGSALIQNLSYRSGWYLITQKGLSGFSPYEDLHLVESNGWPKLHDVRFCVPFEIRGTIIHPDPLPSNNQMRVEFCEKHDDLPLFCDADVVNDPLIPAPVWKQPSSINKIYNIPIIVMSGENSKFLPLTLETLVHQPGIRPSMIVVYHLPKNTMVPKLAELFGFLSEELTPTPNYCERIAEAFEISSLLYSSEKEIIFIGENVIVAPDFMYYLGQLLSNLMQDPSLLSVSALNENGFKFLSGDPNLAYRVEYFYQLAVLVRKDFFQRSWCNKSSTNYSDIPLNIIGHSLIPDVSRVTLASHMISDSMSRDISSVFLSHDRTVTYEQNIPVKAPETLFSEDYERELKLQLGSVFPIKLTAKLLKMCPNRSEIFQKNLLEDLPSLITNATNVSNRLLGIYFHQNNEDDIQSLQYLTKCIGLFYHSSYPVRGLYKGIIRFMLKDYHAALIGTKSPFFTLKTDCIHVVKYDKSCKCLAVSLF